MRQRTQSLLLCTLITSGRQSCKTWSLASNTWPNLRCQRYGLVVIGTSETLLTKELKTDPRMEETAETYLQEAKDCSK